MKNFHKKRVILFLLILVTLTCLQNFGAIPIPSEAFNSLFIMWIPGISAILVAIFTGLSIRSFGWGFSIKWLSIGWFIPIFYATLAYNIVWFFGLGDVPNPTFLERARFTLGAETDSDLLIIIYSFFYITIINLIPNMLFCLGEELGWRGFLVPQLTKWMTLKKAGWISGIIWATWHLPGISSGAYASEGLPLWYQIFCFTILVISSAMILAILRMRSNSLWPAVVFHAVHNGVIQHFYDRITLDTGMTIWFIGEFGISLAIVVAIFAVVYSKFSYPS